MSNFDFIYIYIYEYLEYEKHKESDFQVMKKIINFHMDKLVLTSKDETGSVMPLKNKCSHMYSVFQCLKMWKNPAANYVTFDFNCILTNILYIQYFSSNRYTYKRQIFEISEFECRSDYKFIEKWEKLRILTTQR